MRHESSPTIASAVFGLLAFAVVPTIARADVIWPAAILEERILTWWAIAAGLLAEWPIVRFITGTSWGRSFGINVLMNLASTAVGVLLIPLLGIAWEVFPGLVLYRAFNVGTFNPGTWIATVFLATFANALLEGLVLRFAFKVKFTTRVFWLLSGANLVSVGVAVASLVVSPSRF